MVIAVHINTYSAFLSNADYLVEVFEKLALQHPQYSIIFLADKGFDKKITAPNISIVSTGAVCKKPLLLQYQLYYKIPSLLRKYNAAVLFTSGVYCSLRTPVPQCIMVNDLSFLERSNLHEGNWSRFYKKNSDRFVAKAKYIITSTQLLKTQLIDQYKTPTDKIDVGYYGINEIFKPVFWQQKSVVKQTFTEGLEYFLYAGPVQEQQNLLALLKAFSFFKKRQKSNMQLVIASPIAITDNGFIKSLSSFKYRSEVKLVENVQEEDMAKIIASAYALVYPAIHQPAAVLATAAMQCEAPVIIAHTATAKEIYGEAVLYVNADDFNDIADKMMLIFKDEDKRFELIAKGRQRAAFYQWDNAVSIIAQAIEKCTAF